MKWNLVCTKCDKEIEFESDEFPSIKCNQCGKIMERRIFFNKTIPIVFKGNGWACTESKTESMVKSVQPAVHKAHQAGKI